MGLYKAGTCGASETLHIDCGAADWKFVCHLSHADDSYPSPVVHFLPEPKVAEIVGGSPHGFGVWIDGKYHPIEIGSLGTLIVGLQEEVARLKAEAAVVQQDQEDYVLVATVAKEYQVKLDTALGTLKQIANDAGAPTMQSVIQNSRYEREEQRKILNDVAWLAGQTYLRIKGLAE
jgi:hypothetical protein